jgi:hypothetical protein
LGAGSGVVAASFQLSTRNNSALTPGAADGRLVWPGRHPGQLNDCPKVFLAKTAVPSASVNKTSACGIERSCNRMDHLWTDDIEQCALAGSGWPDQRDELLSCGGQGPDVETVSPRSRQTLR